MRRLLWQFCVIWLMTSCDATVTWFEAPRGSVTLWLFTQEPQNWSCPSHVGGKAAGREKLLYFTQLCSDKPVRHSGSLQLDSSVHCCPSPQYANISRWKEHNLLTVAPLSCCAAWFSGIEFSLTKQCLITHKSLISKQWHYQTALLIHPTIKNCHNDRRTKTANPHIYEAANQINWKWR